MNQTRQKAADNLRELQGIQQWALAHDIHSFEITAACYKYDDEGKTEEELIREYGDTRERFLYVSIFKTGDDTDEDYLHVTIIDHQDAMETRMLIARVKGFIGMEG